MAAPEMKAIRAEMYRRLNRFARAGQIVFAGSSLCEGFPVNELLMDRGQAITVYNRGISGDTIAGYRGRLEDCVCALEPRKVFINIGTNDMNGEVYDESLLLAGYRALLEEMRGRVPRAEIYVLSYYPVCEELAARNEFSRWRTNARVRSANAGVKRLAAELGLRWIDLDGLLEDETGGLRREYTMDGIHLFADAYALVLERLLPYMKS